MRRTLGTALLLALWLAALLALRHWLIEPRAWAAACALPGAPLACAPRTAMLWMQETGGWGLAALAFGLASFPLPALPPLAIAAGLAGAVNYDASFAVLGAALGLWAWLSRPAAG